MTRTAAQPTVPAPAPADPAADGAVERALARLPRVVDLLAARAAEHDRDGTFPYQGVETVHEAGLLTLTVGRRHGGPGAGLADTVRVLARLGRGDASVALLAAHTLLHHAEQARTAPWPAALYRRLLTESRRGPALVGTLRAPAGRPPAVTAHWQGDAWRLVGRAPHCPGAEALAWLVVEARTAEDRTAQNRPRTGLFLVRADSPGLEIDPAADQLGLRAAAGHDVLLADTRIGTDAAHLPKGPAFPADPLAAAWRQLALTAVLLGTARAALDWSAGRLRGTAATHRRPLGELDAALTGAEELVHGLAARTDADPAAATRAPAVQLLAARTAADTVQRTLTLTGSTGLDRRHPLERHLRDTLSLRTQLPAEDAVLDALGESLLGG
ncbi:acyl-CoA dehydrogenase family protein [Kitasatospora cineracea]|uniref:Alkylation response protein AidB-like acyl-CoA dehydrogenase n=1 Tax=Kitasatospora cineracea TaxID=88074 RepID=A0A8G1UPF4_9ACTN|nr:acyl-CoA dehydrogenase family protein [Kitasatospora cineracea]ROR45332.1 alkylation response protein AidB-like acyl-CoA dehydrogenase [Kitasatospora cineracea]